MNARSEEALLPSLQPFKRKAAPVAWGGFREFSQGLAESAPPKWQLLLLRRLGGSGGFLFERGLRGGEAGDGHAERRAAHVGEADLVAELHRVRVATVFAAGLPAGRQVPSFMPDLVPLPFSTAIFINWPTPVWSIEAKGLVLQISSSA